MHVKIFGREPAVIIGAIEAILALLLSFGLFHLTQDTVGIIMAVVTAGFGIYSAYVLNETVLPAVLGFVKAAVALFAVFGFTLTDAQLGAVLALVSGVFALFLRTQAEPVASPTFAHVPRGVDRLV